jgi:hypothetical protein
MKKNRMMRVASGLMVAVLMTTSAISGTFAKYITQTSASDSARVAKFGVTIGTAGSLFGESYQKHASDSGATSISNTVESTVKVVAPGTSSADVGDGGGLVFSATGTPEVAVKVSFSVDTDSLKDIVLPAATYTDYTVVPNGTFSVASDYHPLQFTLKWNGVEVDCGGHTLQDIVSYLNDDTNSKYFAPNTDLSTAFGNYTLTWEWPYDNGKDKEDTFLGQHVAEIGNLPDTPASVVDAYSHEVNLAITMTVTQVD